VIQHFKYDAHERHRRREASARRAPSVGTAAAVWQTGKALGRR
jgi:hypothetical protein